MTAIDRRCFLGTLPALALAPRLLAQSGPPLRVRGLSQLTLTVSDVGRSLAFYQGLFGMPVQARQGTTVFLRVGAGPQFLALKPAGAGEAPSISAFGMSVEDFAADRVVKALAAQGAKPTESGATVVVADPSGIVFQLHDPSYCGGTGPRGSVCGAIEPAPTAGRIAARDLSHFTINVSDQARTVAFYQNLFGFDVQARQGAAPAYGVGPGVHFLMFAGGGAPGGRGDAGRGGPAGAPAGAPPQDAAGRGAGDAGRGAAAPRGPRIDHACLAMNAFNPDAVTKILTGYGLTARPAASRDPLVTYISLRMPNRGGAPGGTPELYLTDPDGLAIQLQDMGYCGGGGFLGDVCPPL